MSCECRSLAMLMITNRAIAPDNKRIVVKLDASIAPSANARRHKTEFAAKATNARHVRVTVLRAVLIIDCRRWISEVDHLLLEISSMIKFPQPSSNMFSKPQSGRSKSGRNFIPSFSNLSSSAATSLTLKIMTGRLASKADF